MEGGGVPGGRLRGRYLMAWCRLPHESHQGGDAPRQAFHYACAYAVGQHEEQQAGAEAFRDHCLLVHQQVYVLVEGADGVRTASTYIQHKGNVEKYAMAASLFMLRCASTALLMMENQGGGLYTWLA